MTFPEYPKNATPETPPVLPDGVSPLPLWAYGEDSLKVDPTNTKREEGWAKIPDENKGEEPPLEWQNNEMFNNGQWIAFFKKAIDYIKAGFFDGDLDVEGSINSRSIIKCRNGVYIFNADGTKRIGISVDPTIEEDLGFKWPKNYPEKSGMSLQCDDIGNMRFYYTPAELVIGNKSGTPAPTGFIGETIVEYELITSVASTGPLNLSKITLSAGNWILSASVGYKYEARNVATVALVCGITPDSASISGFVNGRNSFIEQCDYTETIEFNYINQKSIPFYQISVPSGPNKDFYLVVNSFTILPIEEIHCQFTAIRTS